MPRRARPRCWLSPRAGGGSKPRTKLEATSILPPRTEDCTLKAWYLFLFAGDGKPEPSAAETLRGRGISLAELLEQFCLLLRSHADAGVGDGELDEAAAIAHLA